MPELPAGEGHGLLHNSASRGPPVESRQPVKSHVDANPVLVSKLEANIVDQHLGRGENQQLPLNEAENSRPAIILRWLLQVAGLIAAILFGTFSILAYEISKQQSNVQSEAQSDSKAQQNMESFVQAQQATSSNLLAFAILCTTAQNSEYEQICKEFNAKAIPSLNDTLQSLFNALGSTPSATPVPTASATASPDFNASPRLSNDAQIAIGVSVSIILLVAIVTWLTWAKEQARKLDVRRRYAYGE